MGKVIDNMPSYYANSVVMTNLTGAEDNELARFDQDIQTTLDQFFVNTAEYTLDRWEKEFGIKTNPTKPLAERRSVIKSKMRGSGTITVSLIENVAESYDGGDVAVTEQPELYQFTVTFVDTRGIPPNLDDLKEAIEQIKPAHLAVIYSFSYLVWNELDTKVWTWNDLDAQTLTWDELEVLQ